MRITQYSDYSMRVLIYLHAKGESRSTIQEIANAYDISKNHLMKVVNQLTQLGYVHAVRGKQGGITLARSADQINIGVLLRETEQDLGLVECFRPDNACTITPACRLTHVLREALDAFLAVLDQYTLADLVQPHHQPALARLLKIDTVQLESA